MSMHFFDDPLTSNFQGHVGPVSYYIPGITGPGAAAGGLDPIIPPPVGPKTGDIRVNPITGRTEMYVVDSVTGVGDWYDPLVAAGDVGNGYAPQSYTSTQAGTEAEWAQQEKAQAADWQQQDKSAATAWNNSLILAEKQNQYSDAGIRLADQLATARDQQNFAQQQIIQKQINDNAIIAKQLDYEQAKLMASADFVRAMALQKDSQAFQTQQNKDAAAVRSAEFEKTFGLQLQQQAANEKQNAEQNAISKQSLSLQAAAQAQNASNQAAQLAMDGQRLQQEGQIAAASLAFQKEALFKNLAAQKEAQALDLAAREKAQDKDIAAQEKLQGERIQAEKESKMADLAQQRQTTFVEMLGKDPVRAVMFALGLGPEADQFNVASQAVGQALPPMAGAPELATRTSQAVGGALKAYGAGGTPVSIGQQGVQGLGTPEMAARAVAQGGADVKTLLSSAFGVGSLAPGEQPGLSTEGLLQRTQAVTPKGVLTG